MSDAPMTAVSILPLISPMQALIGLLLAIVLALVVLGLLALGIRAAARMIRRGHGATVIRILLVGLAAVLTLAQPTPPEVTVTEFGAVDWPALHGGPDRRGTVSGTSEPSEGQVVWSFIDQKTQIKCVYSSPAVVGNRVYVTTARWEIFKKDGSLCCVDADTGGLVWRYGQGMRATFSSPAVSGKYLVVGEGLYLISDARVFCFDVAAGEGERSAVKLWEYRTASHVESSPCIGDGRAYVGAGSDGFYCFALEPRADGSANVLWHLPGQDMRGREGQVFDPAEGTYADCESSPIYHDGKVYFGLGNGGQAVVCVAAATGRLLWRVVTPYAVFSAPTISDGRLYFATGSGGMIRESGIRPAGEVWCIDLASYEVLWKYDCGENVLGSVVADGQRLYCVSRDGKLHCISTEGKLLGSWEAGASVVSSPAVGPRAVYVTAEGGKVIAVDKNTMKPLWESSFDDGNSLGISSPALARGRLYIGTDKNGLLCLGDRASPSPSESSPAKSPDSPRSDGPR